MLLLKGIGWTCCFSLLLHTILFQAKVFFREESKWLKPGTSWKVFSDPQRSPASRASCSSCGRWDSRRGPLVGGWLIKAKCFFLGSFFSKYSWKKVYNDHDMQDYARLFVMHFHVFHIDQNCICALYHCYHMLSYYYNRNITTQHPTCFWNLSTPKHSFSKWKHPVSALLAAAPAAGAPFEDLAGRDALISAEGDMERAVAILVSQAESVQPAELVEAEAEERGCLGFRVLGDVFFFGEGWFWGVFRFLGGSDFFGTFFCLVFYLGWFVETIQSSFPTFLAKLGLTSIHIVFQNKETNENRYSSQPEKEVPIWTRNQDKHHVVLFS